MRLRSVHPGHSVDEVVENTGFEVIVPDGVGTTPEPRARRSWSCCGPSSTPRGSSRPGSEPGPAPALRRDYVARGRQLGQQVGLLEAGAEDVAVAAGGPVLDPLAGLDEEGVAAGLGGVDDAAVQQRQLAAAAAGGLEGGADPELGDARRRSASPRRPAARRRPGRRSSASPSRPGSSAKKAGGPGGQPEPGRGDHPERLLVAPAELDHLDVAGGRGSAAGGRRGRISSRRSRARSRCAASQVSAAGALGQAGGDRDVGGDAARARPLERRRRGGRRRPRPGSVAPSTRFSIPTSARSPTTVACTGPKRRQLDPVLGRDRGRHRLPDLAPEAPLDRVERRAGRS